ncbi:hypothetical protein K492DRAFT_217933 [Lichtheimia hyalospora FSU 10163]|nr:hypothetical protein K492DRAFT_217933 [Lichtheimia hyalospora FSU 10163]
MSSNPITTFGEQDPYKDIIHRVVTNLFSFDTAKQEKVLKHYYFDDASFASPLLCTSGVDSIRRVLLVWKALNSKEPRVDKICFDGQRTCTVFLTQPLCPRMIPFSFFQIDLPVMVTLTFQDVPEDHDLIKIIHHEEHWTAQGIIQAMPGIAHCWYDRLIRVTVGQLLATAGGMLHSANETALLLSKRGREIEHGCKQLEQSRKLNPTRNADSSAESSAATTDVDVGDSTS